MSDDMVYDEERELWRPGRRTFLFIFGAAVAGTLLARPGPVSGQLLTAPNIPLRPKMLDPRMVWQATCRELGGDDSLARELGLKPFTERVTRGPRRVVLELHPPSVRVQR